jgi:hypothetical protein
MNRGLYFKVDENSDYANGILYFRYIPIIRSKRKGGESDYPIYMTISSSSINFFIQERLNQESTYKHTELFHLPLSTNLRSRDNLKNLLKEFFNKPVQEVKFSSYTCRKNLDPPTYADLDFPEVIVVSNHWNINSETFFITYRQLILDFLFDLEHSQVFINSPYYEKAEESLRQDLFFSSLASKYDFYYKKELLKKGKEAYQKDEVMRIKEVEDGKMTNENLKKWQSNRQSVIKKLYDDYILARNQWLEIICSPGMDKIINPVNNWFTTIEKEHRNIYFKDNIPENSKFIKNISTTNESKIIWKNSSKWFLRRYDFISAARLAMPIQGNLFLLLSLVLLMFVYILVSLFFDSKLFEFDFALLIKIPLSLIIFVQLFVILGYLKTRLFLMELSLPRILMASTSAWLLLISSDEGWRSHFDFNINYSIIIGIIITIVLFLFMIREVQNLTLLKIKNLLLRVTIVFLIGLSYSLVVGALYSSFMAKTLLTRTEIVNDYFNESKSFDNEQAWKYKEQKVNVTFEDFTQIPSKKFLGNDTECNIMYKYQLNIPFVDDSFSLYLFPGMLVINSFLALFIGIFLQLIFEEKPVTELS